MIRWRYKPWFGVSVAFVIAGGELFSPSVIAAKVRKPSSIQANAQCNEKLADTHEYPFGIEKTVGNHFTYGYETEYSIAEARPELFDYYVPTADLISLADWKKLSIDSKRAWVIKNKDKIFPEGPKKPGKLVLSIENKFLPKNLILDETGNVEIVSPEILHNYGDFDSAITFLDQTFGEGYVQAMLGFGGSFVFSNAENTDAYIGLRFLLGEMDQLEKLSKAYESHLANKKYIPAKSFTHPFLGPMHDYRADFFREIAHRVRRGNIDKEVIAQISKLDFSYKYTSSTAFRPDLNKNNKIVLNEVRDCVKNYDCLRRRILRDRYFFMQNWVKAFHQMESVRHHNPLSHFALLSNSGQALLNKAFAARETTDELQEKVAADTARNFSYPMADWYSWVEQMQLSKTESETIYAKIKQAQEDYKNTLSDLGAALEANQITKEQAQDQVRIALAKFSYDLKLHEVMHNWLNLRFPGYLNERGKF